MQRLYFLMTLWLFASTQVSAQNACDLPAQIGMNEIPIVINGADINPQRTVLIHENVDFSFPSFFFPISGLTVDFNADGTFVSVASGSVVNVTYRYKTTKNSP